MRLKAATHYPCRWAVCSVYRHLNTRSPQTVPPNIPLTSSCEKLPPEILPAPGHPQNNPGHFFIEN